ncbi:serine/threonine protein kinase, partial [bacterium]|nr:serine/threonine protein kinase [candidate division CSSED10-310 bacterium]
MANEILNAVNPEQENWNLGDVLLDQYRIERLLGEGGMGKVYLVRRQSFDRAYFAIKTLHATLRDDMRKRRLFLKELQTWIDLHDHPHITAFRFFRTIQNRLVIFSEYVDGGSLSKWIQTHRLLTIDKILDIAIQIAWGLSAAHVQGVVHQDIKPSNILLTRQGIAKITDFGLSRAMTVSGLAQHHHGDSSSLLVTSSGMTPAYGSPEQIEMRKLGYKTDMWSWGLTILEMFTGGVTWELGCMAQYILERHMNMGPVKPYPLIPGNLHGILERCFQDDPEDRWSSMGEIADNLISLYQEVTNTAYPRKKPRVMLRKELESPFQRKHFSVGEWDDPSVLLQQAISEAKKDITDLPEQTKGLSGSWKTRMLFDLEVLEETEIIYLELIRNGNAKYNIDLANVLIHKGLVLECLDDWPGAIALQQQGLEILEKVPVLNLPPRISYHMLNAYCSTAWMLNEIHESEAALHLLEKAIKHVDTFDDPNEKSRQNHIRSTIYNDLGIVLRKLGRAKEAQDWCDKSIALKEDLVYRQGLKKFSNDLSGAYDNKSKLLQEMHRIPEAIDYMSRAIDLREKIYAENKSQITARALVLVYSNMAVYLAGLKRFEEALTNLEKAIHTIENLPDADQYSEINKIMAKIYNIQGYVQYNSKRVQEAKESYTRSIDLFERLLYEQGLEDVSTGLMQVSLNLAFLYMHSGNAEKALSIYLKTVPLSRHLFRKNQPGTAGNLLSVLLNLGGTYAEMEKNLEAIRIYRKALSLLNWLFTKVGKRDLQIRRIGVKLDIAELTKSGPTYHSMIEEALQ